MNPYYLLMYTVISALLAYGLANMFFGRAADRGLGASQWLLVAFIWFVMMLGLLFYQQYLRFII